MSDRRGVVMAIAPFACSMVVRPVLFLHDRGEDHGMKDLRNGFVTGLGVLLGFGLNFFATWGSDPTDWDKVSSVAAWLMVLGLLLLVGALFTVLGSVELPEKQYKLSVWSALLGVVLLFLGVLSAVQFWRTFGNSG